MPKTADLPLYHWSPSIRRKQILRYGLRPGMWSTDRLWKPPHVCLSPDAAKAWSLSGATSRGQEHSSWDLWQVWLDNVTGYEELVDDRDDSVKEVRVFERIYKRDVWYVGTRTA